MNSPYIPSSPPRTSTISDPIEDAPTYPEGSHDLPVLPMPLGGTSDPFDDTTGEEEEPELPVLRNEALRTFSLFNSRGRTAHKTSSLIGSSSSPRILSSSPVRTHQKVARHRRMLAATGARGKAVVQAKERGAYNMSGLCREIHRIPFGVATKNIKAVAGVKRGRGSEDEAETPRTPEKSAKKAKFGGDVDIENNPPPRPIKKAVASNIRKRRASSYLLRLERIH